MTDIRLALMCGIDIPIPECKVILHQPSIKEIAYIGEADFLLGLQTICLHKTMFVQDKTDLEQISNFQIFMTVINNKEVKDQKNKILKVFKLIFPEKQCLITPNSIILKQDNQDDILIDNTNFDFLQNIIRQVCCIKGGPMDQQTFNPANDKAKEIAQKLMRGRERVAKQKGSSNSSFFSQYLSILTVGIPSMSLQNLMDLTMFQLYDLIERYSLYINWDLDIKQRLAGGKPDSKPDNWMKNIH